MSTLSVDKVEPVGSTLTFGESGDTFVIPTGAIFTNNGTATGFASGNTYASQWRLNTNLSVSGAAPGTNIAANWEQPASTDFPGVIGSGSPMSVNASTGAWTFPATGVWYVALTVESEAITSAHESGRYIYTTDSTGSSWEKAVFTNHTHAQSAIIQVQIEWLMKVANTTTDLVRFSAGTSANTDNLYGDTDNNRTYATFIKLGDAS
tara:strand:+ start:1157 stop:1777 length:621 start_codon:yes stop_codon:yes gene_type:complete